MNRNLQIFLNKYARLHRTSMMVNDQREEYQDSPQTFTAMSGIFRPRIRNFILLIPSFFLISLVFLLLFRSHEEKIDTIMDEEIPSSSMKQKAQTLAVDKHDVKLALESYFKSINPHDDYPDDVNSVKPHHIRVIGAMGDSLTIGSRAQNYFEKLSDRYPGNSYFTGMDEEIDGHLTIYNIFRVIAEETGNKIFGGSTGVGYGENTGLNVAISGMKSDDIPRQANELVKRIRSNKDINIERDWKLVSLWIGTNDVGNLGYREETPISVKQYKADIEEGLRYLKENLPRTIVSVIGMFPAQLLQEAQSILKTGKRAKSEENQKKLDALSDGYRNVSYELQNEGKFNDKNFTVVVQPFATEYASAYVDKLGNYNSSFYALDLFHLSKLGHAILAKHYWQNLFEPIGEKTKRAQLGDLTPEIFSLDENNCYIKTIGNSKKHIEKHAFL